VAPPGLVWKSCVETSIKGYTGAHRGARGNTGAHMGAQGVHRGMGTQGYTRGTVQYSTQGYIQCKDTQGVRGGT
jgi:hypothetical protein